MMAEPPFALVKAGRVRRRPSLPVTRPDLRQKTVKGALMSPELDRRRFIEAAGLTATAIGAR
jgi:hypothetical protein